MGASMPVPSLLATHPDATAAPIAAIADLASAICAQAPRLRRLAHRLLGWRTPAHELDDVVQDVLLKAWRHRDAFRGEAAYTTWLTKITLTTVASHARNRRRRQRLFFWLRPDEPTIAERATGEPAIGESPSTEPLARTQRALQRLRHDDREVLVLRYLEQRPIPEIADLLGASRAAVDARLTRARVRLRAELGLPEAT
jgi:RNA polymerase sigma-70 factor, ECF subfamily